MNKSWWLVSMTCVWSLAGAATVYELPPDGSAVIGVFGREISVVTRNDESLCRIMTEYKRWKRYRAEK